MNKSLDDKVLQYTRSEITVVALEDKLNKKFYNIFSIAEMCSEEQMKSQKIISEDGKFPYKRMKISSNFNLFIRREYRDTAQAALDFYRGVGGNGRRISNQENDILYDFGKLVEEPPNEVSIIVNSNSYYKSIISNIIPYYWVSAKVCCKLNSNREFNKLLSEEELLKAEEYIYKELGIQLIQYMQFWGAVILCMPNPYLRNVNCSLGKEGLFLKVSLLFRKNKELNGGRIELIDEREFGIGFQIEQFISESSFIIQLPNEPDRLRMKIYAPDGELLQDETNYFIKEINLQMGIKGGKRKFHLKQGNKEEIISIDTISYENITIKGNNNEDDENILSLEKEKRAISDLEKNRTFVYFSGNKEEQQKAKSIILELIGEAKENCIICDPYFSGNDLLKYGIHITSNNVTLKVINSAAFLVGNKDGYSCEGEYLLNVIKQFGKRFPVECYVLRGNKRSPLHDRYIVVDSNVYLLGSSLSEFGSRATTLYRVPNPKMLIREAKRWMKTEPRLEQWIKSREQEVEE